MRQTALAVHRLHLVPNACKHNAEECLIGVNSFADECSLAEFQNAKDGKRLFAVIVVAIDDVALDYESGLA